MKTKKTIENDITTKRIDFWNRHIDITTYIDWVNGRRTEAII